MQMRPMMTVKKAAALLGVDKSELRAKVSAGQIQGERKLVGEKEKWFVYSSELDMLLDNMPALLDPKNRTSLEGLQTFFEVPSTLSHVEEHDPELLQVEAVIESTPENNCQLLDLDRVIESLTIEFAYRISAEQQEIIRLRIHSQEQAALIDRLLPMERALQLEVKQGCLKEVELKHLRHQVESLTAQLDALKAPWWKRLQSWFSARKKSLPEQDKQPETYLAS